MNHPAPTELGGVPMLEYPADGPPLATRRADPAAAAT
jgi:hypothetical protein